MSEKFLNQDHPAVQAELEKKENELLEYMQKLHITSEEATLAYEQSLGIPIEKTVREEVFQLAQKIDDLTRNGLPLNRVPELLEEIDNIEISPEVFDTLVGSLQITDNEKKVLRSIVEKKRAGELEVLDPKTKEEIATYKIPKDTGKDDSQHKKNVEGLALFLAQFVGQKIEIVFSQS